MFVIGLKFKREDPNVDRHTRRRHERRELRGRCIYSQYSDNLGSKICHISTRGATLNISESGMCIEGRQCIIPETPVRVILQIGRKEINFEGITKWTVPSDNKEHWRVGLSFTSSYVQARDLCRRLKNLDYSGLYM